MFMYEKKLQYPVKIKNTNPKLASIIISQYGGPDGELGASLRYLSQRYAMPYPELKAVLTDIGTEELGHLEMIGAIVHQLTRNLTEEQIKTAGFDTYFVDRTTGVYPTAASGFPWSAASMAVKGDVICDLSEDMAAEQKARVTYDNILRLSDDPDVNDVIRFLREREDTKLNFKLRESLNPQFTRGRNGGLVRRFFPPPAYKSHLPAAVSGWVLVLTTLRREKYGKKTQEHQDTTQPGFG